MRKKLGRVGGERLAQIDTSPVPHAIKMFFYMVNQSLRLPPYILKRPRFKLLIIFNMAAYKEKADSWGG